MKKYPDLVFYDLINEYRLHYEEMYCKKPIITNDGIPIFFKSETFIHAFYESSSRDGKKDEFSKERSQRIDWIKKTLENPLSIHYKGWSKKYKSYQNNRRVSIVFHDFVVVVQLFFTKKQTIKGKFITAYCADNSLDKIKKSPKWKINDFIKK